jgi:hypothetical protein
MFGPGEEFLGAQSTTIFFFFFINGSTEESKPSEAHPRIFFLSLLLLPMTRVNPIELFFYGRFRLLLIEQKSLRQSQLTVLHETMSTSWKLRRKSLTVIIVFLVEDSKDEKNLLAGLNLHYVDAMALNDDEKGLSIELFGLIFSTTCLESGNAEFVFPKKFIRRFRKLFSTTLYLFFRG